MNPSGTGAGPYIVIHDGFQGVRISSLWLFSNHFFPLIPVAYALGRVGTVQPTFCVPLHLTLFLHLRFLAGSDRVILDTHPVSSTLQEPESPTS